MRTNIISEENVIDTTKEENIKKYYENLRILIEDAKSKGEIDKFVIIRNDDFFPEDYKWIVNSKDTSIEYRVIASIVSRKENVNNKSTFKFFKKNKEKNKEPLIKKISLCLPVHFRSTKHFTINTPLGLTSEYNAVKSNRTFTIIDDISNFLSSGYGYSISEKDAYLDITHEPLEISDNAIVLISLETFDKIKNNKRMMTQLTQRKLIVYKGDLSLAINMILTENGILPIRTEYEYDDDLKKIIESSIKQLCINNNLEYNRPHGFNGHFTSIIDQYDTGTEEVINEFIEYINQMIGENLIQKEKVNNGGNFAWIQYIDTIGYERFINIVESFNTGKQNQILKNRERYIHERNNITQEDSVLFKQALQLIRDNEQNISFQDTDNIITKNVIDFFLSTDLEKQVSAAKMIVSYFNKYKIEHK